MTDSLEAQVGERLRQQGSGWVDQLLAELIPPPAVAATGRSRTAARRNAAGHSRRSLPLSQLSPSPPRQRIRNAARKATATSATHRTAAVNLVGAAIPPVSTVRPPVTRAQAAARAAVRAPPPTGTPIQLVRLPPAARADSRSSSPPPNTVYARRLHSAAKTPTIPAVPTQHTGARNKNDLAVVHTQVAPVFSSEDSSPPHNSDCSDSAVGGFSQVQQSLHHDADIIPTTHSTPRSSANVARHGSTSRGADRRIRHSSTGRYRNRAESPLRDDSGRRGSRFQSPVPSCSSARESPRTYSPSSSSHGSSEDRQGNKRRKTHRGSHRFHSSCRDDTTFQRRTHAATTPLPSRSGVYDCTGAWAGAGEHNSEVLVALKQILGKLDATSPTPQTESPSAGTYKDVYFCGVSPLGSHLSAEIIPKFGIMSTLIFGP
ncbi:hypothetical protein XELAEV_18013216mg [Xenopus laevis]|uniref:Uncharacterized protein n=1 Tax=Xenopus laevis TaxID=8355 RepID=A0A974DQ64_XENLA|nr:hypothetical protein XELAEV_18013216mg [Xenopus laevis]